MEATRAQMFSDVDSAHATVTSTVIPLQPYKDRYLSRQHESGTRLHFPTTAVPHRFWIFSMRKPIIGACRSTI